MLQDIVKKIQTNDYSHKNHEKTHCMLLLAAIF